MYIITFKGKKIAKIEANNADHAREMFNQQVGVYHKK